MKSSLVWFAIALMLTGCSGKNPETDNANAQSTSDAELAASSAAADASVAAADAAVASVEAVAAKDGPKKSDISHDQKESIALILNLNSLLCAKVVEVNQLEARPTLLEVRCIEYRGGTGTKNYIVDLDSGKAFLQ